MKNRVRILNESVVVDTFLLYQFVRRLSTPFADWDAFKLGIIDERGKVLRKRTTLRTTEEKKAWGLFDILVANLKKLLEKVPFARNRLASFAAALFLLKEHKNPKIQDYEFFVEQFLDFIDDIENDPEYEKELLEVMLALDNEDLQKELQMINEHQTHGDAITIYRKDLEEEPANSVGGGGIAGTGLDGQDPAVKPKKKKKKRKLKSFRDLHIQD